MNLADVISAAVYKQLVNVDLPKRGSNQHEINGVVALRQFFGTGEVTRGTITWHRLADNEEPVREVSDFTFYDARAKHPSRTEWRLYYVGDFLHRADDGDVLVLIRTAASVPEIHGLVLQKSSAWLRAAERLFVVSSLNPANFELLSRKELSSTELGIVGQQVLEELGVEDVLLPTSDQDASLVYRTFKRTFPTTRVMSRFARQHTVGVDVANADDTLVKWLQREEQLFRALERILVEEQVRKGFASVDEFVAFSLSVQNRRKSRMGYSLQNNLAALFDANRVQYEPQAVTEGKNRPDFLFPSAKAYHNEKVDSQLLVMLGAKSTLKDRWRQILTEANRIRTKHLCTLEAAISRDQITEMTTRHVQLVIPEAFRETYPPVQRREVWSLKAFIEFVKRKQN
ncbi:MAG: restriction endonuclease [Acidobacteriia bacterium]|nr:restriction endonuclease [Terriglobia bacterium]